MGVPKFFRYISERYPCLSELAREQSIPDFDNLYLDMNGIVHNCSHPDDGNVHLHITEEKMFKDIFTYIDKLFFLIKPQKLFFMAVDGVAPRAKMNQQRSRRFRSAKEAEDLENKAKNRGEVIEHERFDSNCITPGTEFMVRLHEALQYFIKSKISADPLWQKCRVILSGHDAPGEGEHKIMDYIRYLKSQPGYDPNTRHCLYGLDADLIILGLCTHELHFVVLREEVKFGTKKKASLEETRFFLLHIGLLRQYLELEFDALRKANDNFDIANLIDDWVLMGFLVGNDFIPHLPCLHISTNALPLLYKTYIKVYSTLGGNINESGKLNLERLEKYFAALSDVEFELFEENYVDLKYFEAKQSKNGIDEAFDFDVDEITNGDVDDDLAALIESSNQFSEANEDDVNDANYIADEFEKHKRNYYLNKLNQNMSSEQKREQAIGYVTALQWILDYYYRGVQSWDWYYPHHYAPFVSDLKNFKDHEITFNMGKPFLPLQQLLAVLPAASKELLPPAYRDLMTSADSTLIDYYPLEFKTDLNGKQHEWEAVVLIPFIDEQLLVKAIAACDVNLTSTERTRNQHGPMLQYDYSAASHGSAPGVGNLEPLSHVFCTERKIWSSEVALTANKTVCIELPNAARSVFFPGFPTMKHLKYNFRLTTARVKVFNYPSRNENLILLPESRAKHDDVYMVAEKYLNQVVFIGWPHLIKAKVVSVSCKEKLITSDGIRDNDAKAYDLQMKLTKEHLNTRMGIEFDDFTVLVHARTHAGCTYVCGNKGNVVVTDEWSQVETAYPAQGIVAEIAVNDNLKHQFKKVEELFPVDSKVFFLGNPYYGSEGTVLDPQLVYGCGRLKVNITVLPEPDFAEAKFTHSQLVNDYTSFFQTAATIGISAKVLAHISGTVMVKSGERRDDPAENISKTNVGLQLKFPKQQEERAGYARRLNNQWVYSSKAIQLIKAYCDMFPMVINYLSTSPDNGAYAFEHDLFNKETQAAAAIGLQDVVKWLKQQEHLHAEIIPCGSDTLEKECIEKMLESIEILKTLPVKTVKLQVKPHLLLKSDVSLPNTYKAKRAVRLFDRVVIVKTTYMVPLGAKGTVIGIHPVRDPNPVRLECVKAVENFLLVLFDTLVPNGSDVHNIAHQRVAKVPESSVLLIFNSDVTQKELMAAKFYQSITTPQQQQQQQQQHQQHLQNPRPMPANAHNDMGKVQILGADGTTKLSAAGKSGNFWAPAQDTRVKHENSQQHKTQQQRHQQQQEQQKPQQQQRSQQQQQQRAQQQQQQLEKPRQQQQQQLEKSRQQQQQQLEKPRQQQQQQLEKSRPQQQQQQRSQQQKPQSTAAAAVQSSNAATKNNIIVTTTTTTAAAALPTQYCQEETLVLKSLLGLAPSNNTQPQQQQSQPPQKQKQQTLQKQQQQQQQQPQPTAMRAANQLPYFPQPPTQWKHEAQSANSVVRNQNQQQQQQQQQHAAQLTYAQTQQALSMSLPKPTTAVAVGTLDSHVVRQQQQQQQQQQQLQQQQQARYQKSLVYTRQTQQQQQQQPQNHYQQHHHQQQQYSQQQHHQQQQANSNCFSPESLNQRGAFIPLQVMRANQQPQHYQQQQQQQQQQHHHHHHHQQQHHNHRQQPRNAAAAPPLPPLTSLSVDILEQQLQQLSLRQQTAPMTSSSPIMMTKSKNAQTPHKQTTTAVHQKTPRPSKIGAKFDVPL